MPDELNIKTIEKLVYGGDGLAHADAKQFVYVYDVMPAESGCGRQPSPKAQEIILANIIGR